MAYVIVFVLLVCVVLIVTSPLRRVARPDGDADQSGTGHGFGDEDQASPDRLELEAARDAKLREIRDAELDHDTGKLSDDDFTAIDSTLRAEAMQLLRRLDALEDD